MPPASLRRGAMLLIALAVLASTTSAAHAQEEVRPHSLEPGTWALGFRIGPEFELTSLEGTLITIKKHTSAAGAWRAGISLDLLADDRAASWPTVPGHDEFAALVGDVRLVVSRLQYSGVGRDVKFYWALGPDVRWRGAEAEYERVDPAGPGFTSTNSFTELHLRLGGEVGSEWFMTRDLSLHAGYAASGGYAMRKSTDGNGNESKDTTWVIAGEGVWLGLNLYL